jgi:NADH:ubiquinone oxidoreductase subunit 5 (subunit L)/multisubunit Na+/H+ antiporter MnhA subunit
MMNIFNKVIMILILICIICISLVAVFNEFAGFFQWSDFALGIFNPQVDIPTYITVLAAIAVFAISVVLLLLEFYKRKSKVANISSSKEGNAMITLDTVASQIKNETLKIEGLEDLKAKIIPKATGIIVNMYAKLREDLDIPATMQEIIKSATSIVSEKLGIKVIKINLTTTGLASEKKEAESEKEEKGKAEEEKNEAVPEQKEK